MMKRALFLSFLLLSAGASFGASPDLGTLDARSLAMGGALRSLAELGSAARLNPAALSPRRGFFADATYATRNKDAFDAAQFTLVDNITSPMGGAIQYLRLHGKVEREDISLSLSSGKEGLWWGFTGRYVHARERGTAPWHDLLTADVGFLFARPHGIRIAVVGYDLLDTTSRFLDRRVAVGVSRSGIGPWTFAADVVRNLDQDFNRGADLHLGVEYRASDSPWAFRAGQMWRGETGKDYASVGVGWIRDRYEIGYAIQKARQRAGEFLQAISVNGSF